MKFLKIIFLLISISKFFKLKNKKMSGIFIFFYITFNIFNTFFYITFNIFYTYFIYIILIYTYYTIFIFYSGLIKKNRY